MIHAADELFKFIKLNKAHVNKILNEGLALLDADFFTEYCCEGHWFVKNQNVLLPLVLAGYGALNTEEDRIAFVYQFMFSYSMEKRFEPTIKTLLDESGVKLDAEIGDHYLDKCRKNHLDIEFFIPYAKDADALETIKEIVEEKARK